MVQRLEPKEPLAGLEPISDRQSPPPPEGFFVAEYQQHPLSSAFPQMSDEDFGSLVEDIRQHGQRDPVTLHEGMVIDGWHRYMACQELDVPCNFDDYTGEDPVAFVRSKNQHRRHYQKSQQAAIEVALSVWAEAHRPKKSAPSAPLSTKSEMAKRSGASERTIVHAKRAHEAGLGGAVRDGKMSAKVAAAVAAAGPDVVQKVMNGEIDALEAVKQNTLPANCANDYSKDDELHDIKLQLRESLEENLNLRAQLEGEEATESRFRELMRDIFEKDQVIKTLETQIRQMQNTEAQLKRQIKMERSKHGA